MNDCIRLRGARQNNLRAIDLDLPLGELIVIAGVSGAGKSSLAFDTLYAEGQRRYVETFSPYARQFLDRMDRPAAARIDGIPPALALEQANRIRTSRSTVGTLTELTEHFRLLFARAARLYCRGCGAPLGRDSAEGIFARLLARPGAADQRLLITFTADIPPAQTRETVMALLAQQGYVRLLDDDGAEPQRIIVIQDRLRLTEANRERAVEALETALARGRGIIAVYPLDGDGGHGAPWRFSSRLGCADCGIDYQEPGPGLFSFNSPHGACPACRGFGRVIGIDWAQVIPDTGKTLLEGAIKPIQSPSYREVQDDLLRHAHQRGVPDDVPWRALTPAERDWIIAGEGDFESGQWYGLQRFFDWLEGRSYKMHVRVLLSRYRAYSPCPTCAGARLRDEALDWRLGDAELPARTLAPEARFRHARVGMDALAWAALPGLALPDLLALPLGRLARFMRELRLPGAMDQALALLLGEIRGRLEYLHEVGLDYLTLERQARTLSGGELQRIHLTTALGASLVGTLFVLDEPSSGLHARDTARIARLLQRLRTRGNTLLVVEHDAQIIAAADRVIELGPGPGERGGAVIFQGPPTALSQAPDSPTGAYLGDRCQIATARRRRPVDSTTPRLGIRGAHAHNLRGLDCEIPLGRLVCLTGVSGSGKSTLLDKVLRQGLEQRHRDPDTPPEGCTAITGAAAIAEVIRLDQYGLGRNARSNPASYVGAFDAIRACFARAPLARERGYKPGFFSFNSGQGRCQGCGGNGFEHLEMQFLADVYLRCPDCGGRRYGPQALEVRLAPAAALAGRVAEATIAEILDMTVTEALAFFADEPAVCRALEPLAALGLDYLRLGQPTPTLSGGEAQRLALAAHLANAARRKRRVGGLLFLLDEPTTGLHPADIAVLLAALERLLDQGHSVVVIEHQIDFIAAADWLLDLGPEGGDGGGRLLCCGPPEAIAAAPASHTGAALRARCNALPEQENDVVGEATSEWWIADGETTAAAATDAGMIAIGHAREHNLRDLSVDIRRGALTVITGVSGSGKSTLAFDVLFAEGQRRYLESLNAYARQFVQPAPRAAVDAIYGIPPTVAIEQRTSRGGARSTVGTLTEIHHFLRLLYVRLGVQNCPHCGEPITPMSRAAIQARIERDHAGRRVGFLAPLITARKGLYRDLAAWAASQGWETLRLDGAPCPTAQWPELNRYQEHSIELPLGELEVGTNAADLERLLAQALDLGKGRVVVVPPGTTAPETQTTYSISRTCPGCGQAGSEPDPRLFSYNSRLGWCPRCFGSGLALGGFDAEQSGEEAQWREAAATAERPCPACHGARLNPGALSFRLGGLSIAQLSALGVARARAWFAALALNEREHAIARDALGEIRNRLDFLVEVGLGYLALDRAAPTLSGGEAQRIRLAAQLGSNLRGVCYVLDEPTIGLHPRDHARLLTSLQRLQTQGNTLVVVEHDEETIRHAEHVIDLGPGAGHNGGRVIAQGNAAALAAHPDSLTGRYLARSRERQRPARRVAPRGARLRLRGARRHNLHGLDCDIPLGRLVCVTGVSGSGKSSLIRGVLVPNLQQLLKDGERAPALTHCRTLSGWEGLTRVLEVDQTPIGRTPRSCPATYVGVWDGIRKLFAATTEARILGWGPGRFSFNTGAGRCPACEGQGVQRLEMSFLPEARIPCEACHGTRFDRATRQVRFKGLDIAEVLELEVADAAERFAAHPAIAEPLGLLRDVGLGYLRLGQPSATLSGGEAQRIKLVTELAKARPQASGSARRPTLYVLDEPTVGLHMADVALLIEVLQRLVDAGHSVLAIEHNLDLVAAADWLLDLGPEAGAAGGRLVARGVPEDLASSADQPTAQALAAYLQL